ncbi:MAG: hypothetical protein U5N58_12330 [Actinomycetota bacterium]|nr:hypothetical protein [Actinomycetota bacterium]
MKLIPKAIIGVVIFIVALVLILNSFVVVQAGNVQVLTQVWRNYRGNLLSRFAC